MIAPAVFLKERMLGKAAFLLFLLTLPLSVRKVFFVFSPDGSGGFNEYTDISLYLSDVLLLLALGTLLLENRSVVLSISWWKQLFHVEQFKILLFAPVPFLLWAGVSIFWSKSHLLGAYSFSRLILGYLIYVLVILSFVPRGTITKNNTKCSTWNIKHLIWVSLMAGGFIQAVLGIAQFISQSSLGLSFLKESILSPSGAGVAKILLAEESLIRAYGLFPHPNILAGFLGITILFTSAYPLIFRKRMFHVEQGSLSIVPRGTMMICSNWIKENCSTWNNFFQTTKMFHVEQSVLAYRIILGTQIIGFLLTFSKSAFLGLLIAIAYFTYKMFHVEQFSPSHENVPRGTIGSISIWLKEKCSTWNTSSQFMKMFHVEQWKVFFVASLIILSFWLFLGMVNWYYFLTQPFRERLFLEKSHFLIVEEAPFQGVGIGQSVFVMQDFFSEKLFPWQFQPVHNLFLLIFSEIGLVGLLSFLAILILIIVPRGTIGGVSMWIKEKCSTWNNFFQTTEMFHVEQIKSEWIDSVKNVSRGTMNRVELKALLEAAMLFLGVVSLFDHYLWDIQQGQLLFWLILGLFASSRLFHDSIDK
jgi:hypothetical protein